MQPVALAAAPAAAASSTFGDITTAALLASLAGAVPDAPVTLRGTVDNTAAGSVLEVKGATALGQVNLNGGAVRGGTLRLTSGALRFNADGAYGLVGILDGVGVQGGLAVGDGADPFPGYGAVLALRGGVTFAGLPGAARGSVMVTGAASEVRALDAETLDHVDLRFTAPARLASQLLTTAPGTVLALGPDASLDVESLLTLGGGGTFRNAGAMGVRPGGTLAVAPGTVLARAGGSLAVAAGGTLSFSWTGGAAPLNGLAGAVVDGTLALSGPLTSTAYAAALGGVSGAGGVSFNGTLDNTGAALSPGATVAGRLTLSGVLRGGTVTAGTLTLGPATVLDGVALRGPVTLAGTPSLSIDSPPPQVFLRGGLSLLDTSGSGPGALTLSRLSLQASDTERLDSAAVRLSDATLSAADGARLTLGAGLALSVSGSSALLNATNAGSVTVEGNSTLTVDGSFANSGALFLSAGSRLNLTGTTTALGGTVAFLDPMARLAFGGGPSPGIAISATLRDFQNGDSIDLQGLSYSPSLSISLQGGAVQVSQGGAVAARFGLSGGTYAADQFSLAADSAGGTLLRTTHRLSAPASAGPGRDFDPAYYLAHNPDVAAAGVDPLRHYLDHGWKEGRDPNAYFSTAWYLNQNPDVAAAGVNPLQHYEDHGWREGRDPGPNFSTGAYLSANPDVQAAGIDPLQHFLLHGRAEGRSAAPAAPRPVGPQDPLVDRAWYLAQHPDVAASGEDASTHYHRIGWMLGDNPDPFFDTTYYLKTNPDVAAAGLDPLAHFEAQGWREGREPSLAFSDRQYLAANPDVAAAGTDPLAHYLAYGRGEGRLAFVNAPQSAGAPDPLIDRAFYFAQVATIVPASADATASYDQAGWRRGLNPDAFFDTGYYLAHNPDVRAAGMNPLRHYEDYGWKESRDPSAAFSTDKYLAAYPDVRASGADPLLSFLAAGQAQGRTAFGA